MRAWVPGGPLTVPKSRIIPWLSWGRCWQDPSTLVIERKVPEFTLLLSLMVERGKSPKDPHKVAAGRKPGMQGNQDTMKRLFSLKKETAEQLEKAMRNKQEFVWG